MIDTHCHILPRIDSDGPGRLEDSLAMARAAVEDSVTTVVATPHVRTVEGCSEDIRVLVDVFNRQLAELAIPLRVLPGAEANPALDIEDLFRYGLNDTSYLLLEFPTRMTLQDLLECLHEVTVCGGRPIIAHAERIPLLQKRPHVVDELLAAGATVQITAESLTGKFGTPAKICARSLVRRNAVHLLASDAHGIRNRPPGLTQGLRAVARMIGDEAAAKLVHCNPEAVICGKPLNA